MKNYANAKDVLPDELFDEVKKHYTGMLYVPDGMRHQEKRKLIIALLKQKTDAKEIASIVGLSVRRVLQIIAEERDKGLSDAQKGISAVKRIYGPMKRGGGAF
jgi:CRP-like cAMP-binding protein